MYTEVRSRLARGSGLSAFVFIFAAHAALFSAWVAWRISLPLEINVNEPWDAWHAGDAFALDRLYPDRGALVFNNYPPLSFVVVRLVTPLFANAVVAGRVLSLLSLMLIGAASYRCARQLGAGAQAAGLGALWFVATMTRAFSE